jgi:hypothetical protein
MAPLLHLVGTGYSGTTLVSFLANTHPEVVSVGECSGPLSLESGGSLACSCGERLLTCPFWAEITRRLGAMGHVFRPDDWKMRFELGLPRTAETIALRSWRSNRADGWRDAVLQRLPVWGGRLREVGARNRALYQALCAATGKRVVLDASKDPRRPGWLARLAGQEVVVVHQVRDSLAYVASAKTNRGFTLDAAIRAWNRMAGHVTRLQATWPAERFLRLRYEDVCADPVREMNRLAAAAGVEPWPAGPIQFRSVAHHVVGNRMRLGTSEEIRLDTRWCERLTEAEQREVRRRTRRWRRAFGYEAASPSA